MLFPEICHVIMSMDDGAVLLTTKDALYIDNIVLSTLFEGSFVRDNANLRFNESQNLT